jgi:hypothetical protein
MTKTELKQLVRLLAALDAIMELAVDQLQRAVDAMFAETARNDD